MTLYGFLAFHYKPAVDNKPDTVVIIISALQY